MRGWALEEGVGLRHMSDNTHAFARKLGTSTDLTPADFDEAESRLAHFYVSVSVHYLNRPPLLPHAL